MARLIDAILNEQGFSRGATAPMLDLSNGGQFGWSPNLYEWVSNQAYVRRNLICILLEAPTFFQIMPDPEKWVQCLKSLVELHPRTIEGFNAGLTVEYDEHPVGGAGEVQHEVIDVKRAHSEPVFTYVEKYGMPIQTFLSQWIRYGIMDPDTKFAMVGTLAANRPTDMLSDWNSMTCLFIEPDPTHQFVQKSWITTNMKPKGTGEIIGKRDLTSASELLNLSVEFTGISQFNLGTDTFAQLILNQINIVNANPYLRPAFVQGIAADVASVSGGYAAGVESLGAEANIGEGNV